MKKLKKSSVKPFLMNVLAVLTVMILLSGLPKGTYGQTIDSIYIESMVAENNYYYEYDSSVVQVVRVFEWLAYPNLFWENNGNMYGGGLSYPTVSICDSSEGLWEYHKLGSPVLFELYFVRPPVHVMPDSLHVCGIFSVNLHAGNLNKRCRYLWSNGDTTETITVNIPGIYSVRISNTLDTIMDSIIVWEFNPNEPDFGLGDSLTICPGTTQTLDPGVYNTYLWQDGSNDPTYTATVGTYSVTVTSAGCTDHVSVYISNYSIPLLDVSYVTTDTLTGSPTIGKNIVVWDTTQADIDTVFTDRKMPGNTYINFGITPYKIGSIHDIYGSDVESQYYRVRPKSKVCTTIGPASLVWKTTHATSCWTTEHYAEVSWNLPEYGMFKADNIIGCDVYRYNPILHQYLYVGSPLFGNVTYTDQLATSSDSTYIVSIQITDAKSTISSFSNFTKATTVGIAENSDDGKILLYQDPSGKLNLPEWTIGSRLYLYTIIGQICVDVKISSGRVEIPNTLHGLFLIEIINSEKRISQGIYLR